jgi:hypothetical protein
VRLISAIAASVATCFFVVYYSQLSLARFGHEHPNAHLIRATLFLLEWGWCGFAIPVISSVAGVLLLRRSRFDLFLFEIVICGTWLLSLLWAGHCLLMWQAQNVPIFSLGEPDF